LGRVNQHVKWYPICVSRIRNIGENAIELAGRRVPILLTLQCIDMLKFKDRWFWAIVSFGLGIGVTMLIIALLNW